MSHFLCLCGCLFSSEDVIKRLQAKVSRNRKVITRLQKQEQKAPQTATEALGMIRPPVAEEVFQLVSSRAKLRSKGRGKRFPQWLKTFALHLATSVQIVLRTFHSAFSALPEKVAV